MAGTLIVSLDFELFWGMQDCSTLEKYGDNVRGGCKAIPRLLDLFQEYGIHATWATVGFQFAQDSDALKPYLPPEDLRPGYDNAALSAYRCLDGGAAGECFFAPELIRRIAGTPGQEIASHTFSHYYCREPGQTTQQFAADMQAAKDIAAADGYRLTSVVFPRNQTTNAHVQVLRQLGFTAYRDEENDWIHRKVSIRPLKRLLRLADVYLPLTGQGGYTPRSEDGIVNLMGSRMFKPYFRPLAFLEGWKLCRIMGQMRHAAKTGKTFHLWWHPHNVGVRTDYHMQQLRCLLDCYRELQSRYGMRSLNMQEAAEEVVKSDTI